MKIKILLFIMLFLVVSSAAFGQSISIYDIDTTNFPTMKAKFYAFDKDGNQVRPSASELSITEDGVPRIITNVSCPPLRRIKLSVGIMIDTYGYLNLARLGTERLLNFLDMPNEDEVALTYMNGRASIWQDFTKNKTTALEKAKTIPNSPGVDINTMFYSDYSGGIPFIKDRKSDKKVLILVSDLHCPNLNINENQLIADAKANNISIYSVLLNTTDYSGLFKRISAGSSGTVFENVSNETEITNVFGEISYIENNDPCEITWESGVQCIAENIKVEINWNSLKSISKYKQVLQNVAKLNINPSFISFGKISNPSIKDTTITLKAINSDITINDIKLKFGSFIFEIINITFPIIIPNNTTKTITLRCTPTDSSLNYAAFDIETNLCSFYFSANCGYPGKKIKIPTLKLTHPNGGEVFVAGSDTLITWEGISQNDTCQIEFSNDNGKTWETITNEATNLKYNWNKLPNIKSDSCKIRIKQWIERKSNQNDTNRTYKGHTGSVRSVAFSPNGNTLATGSFDNKIKLWDLKTGTLINTLIGHSRNIWSIAYSPDGRTIASVSQDRSIKLWDIATSTLLFDLEAFQIVYSVAFSPDGNTLVTGCNNGIIKIWDVSTGTLLSTLVGIGDIFTVAFSPDGNFFATCGGYTILIWDSKTGDLLKTMTGHSNTVYSVTFSPDGNIIASGSFDNTIKLWDLKTESLINTLTGHSNDIFSVAFNPYYKILASCGRDQTINIWDVETGALLRNLTGHTDWVYSVAFSPNGRTIASGSEDKTIKIWDLEDNTLQSDQSDAVFSIIAPETQFQKLNIDMGQVVVGSTKDTMVTAVLCNVGQAPLHVLGVDVTKGNTNEFMVPRGAGDFFLPPNDCRDMMFAFMPSQVGVRNAKITVKSTIGDYVDTINITGIGIQPTVQIVNKYIDFGYVDIFTSKDTLQAVTIKNISKVDIDIKNTYHSEPNDKDFSTIAGGGAFKLKANETAKLDMRFLPTSVGRTSGTLMFEYDGIGSPAVVQLFGAGIGGKASLKLDTIETETSKIVEYPVKLTLSGDIIKSGANAVNFDIGYNNTLLYPSDNYQITNKDGIATLRFKNMPLTKDPIQTLSTLRFRTGLGNAIETPLIISNFELVGTNEDIEVIPFDGHLQLTDVCYDGGVRLINPNNTIFITKVSPNPVNGNISIDLNLIEIGYTEVAIYNVIGEKVKTIFSKDITETGSFSINSEISDLSNGQYVIIFKTPTYLEKSNILILK